MFGGWLLLWLNCFDCCVVVSFVFAQVSMERVGDGMYRGFEKSLPYTMEVLVLVGLRWRAACRLFRSFLLSFRINCCLSSLLSTAW
ncbi:hypothetical protein V8C26DRAFT_390932 [Trichoderma gracile]